MRQEFLLAYAANIKSDIDGFVANFRDLENVFTEGDTYEEALSNAQEVLDLVLLEMTKDNIEIPVPTPCLESEVLVTVNPVVTVSVLLHIQRD